MKFSNEWWVWAVDIFGLTPGFAIGWPYLKAWLMPKLDTDPMAPATLDSFNMTYCTEGTVVPLIYGTVRVPGNLLWYGNLKIVVSHASGPGQSIDGYYYYVHVWQAIGTGLLELVGIYAGDKTLTFTNSYTYTPGSVTSFGISRTFLNSEGVEQTVTYNPGEGAYFPSPLIGAPNSGADATAMNPVCHAFIYTNGTYGMYFGKNATNMPVLHWIVKKRFPASYPITNAEMSNGTNPAAVIFDLLCKAGETLFNLASFNTAAAYWYTKGYGINISYSELAETRAHIQKVFNYVDGTYRKNEAGEWELTAYTEDDVADPDKHVQTEDFVEFSISRSSWDSVYNFFIGNYTDASNDYAIKTIRVPNSAAIAMLGYRRQQTIELTAFTDLETASKRLWEIAKQRSYPAASIQFKTTLKWYKINVGDIILITNSEYQLVGASFRVVNKITESVEKNTISFEAEQMISTLFDDSFQIGGDPQGENPSYTPEALVHQAIQKVPVAVTTFPTPPNYLALAAREGQEESFNVYISYDGGVTYVLFQTLSIWSLYGLLTADYLSTHTSIDDPVGIYVDAYREDPTFSTLSNEDFVVTERYALIGRELLKFQTVSPGSGSTDLVLTRILRGQYGTPIEDHYTSDPIWLINLSTDNVLQSIAATTFHLKMAPVLGDAEVALSGITALYYSVSSVSSSSSSSSSSCLSSSSSSSSYIGSSSSSSSSIGSSSSSSSSCLSSSSSSSCRSSSSSSSTYGSSSSSSSSRSSSSSSSSLGSSSSSSSSSHSSSSSSSSSSCRSSSSSSSSSSCRSSSSSSSSSSSLFVSSSSSSSSSSCKSSSSSSSCFSSSSSSCFSSSSSSSCRSSSSSSSSSSCLSSSSSSSCLSSSSSSSSALP